MKMIECQKCLASFVPSKTKQKFCSQECINVKFGEPELFFIKELLSQKIPRKEVARRCNEKFYNSRMIRTFKSIDTAIPKLGLSGRSFTRFCDVCSKTFETSWPQARYCSQECHSVVQREYGIKKYKQNPILNVSRQTVRVRKRIEMRRKIILDKFGDKCNKCGINFPQIVFDLHHPNGKKSRKDTPSKVVRGGTDAAFEKMLSEVEQICANCHRLHHAESGNWAPGREGQ